MALEPDGGPGPYGPPSGVIAVIEGYRERGLQTPFTEDVLVRAGITEALAPRIQASMRVLDLTDENNEPSQALQDLRRAPTDEFRDRLAELLRAAYAPIFSFTDPATDSPERVRDAFRPYIPIGQQGRMVTLFMSLCQYAGIIEEIRRPAPTDRARRPAARPARSRRNAPPLRPASRLDEPTPPAVLSGLGPEFGVSLTDDDLARLEDSEFDDVWAALGRVVRARARARARANEARRAVMGEDEAETEA